MTRARWETANQKERMRQHGARGADPLGPVYKPNSPMQQAANERLRLYLETSPRGERDVTKTLDRLERARGTWLRDVLDACEE